MKVFVTILAALAVCATSSYGQAGYRSPLNWMGFKQDGKVEISNNVNVVYAKNHTHVIYMPLRDLPYLVGDSCFDVNKPTVVYVHGWLESGKTDLSTLAVRGAYVDRGDHNVISLDWSHYSKNMQYHLTVIPQLKVIAETIAEYINELVERGQPMDKLHLVGHSLGGQMVGKIGRHVKLISKGKIVIPKIFALDPAGPGFEDHWIDGFEPISKYDGAYVQIIHTNGGNLGMLHRVGHIDFFPDGGSNHPGCDVDAVSSVVAFAQNPCNHYRSWHFFQLTVRDPKAFPAVRCDSYEDFLNKGKCYYDDIEYLGFGADIKSTGRYYLETHANMFNLSKGIEGTLHTKTTVVRLLPPVPTGNNKEGDTTIPSEIQQNEYF